MTVDVVAVEKELARIQRELTNSEVRTSLFNLVVFSRNAAETMASEALNYLLGKRAARVIHIVSDPAADGEVESRLDVSARCYVDSERKSVCFQEIVITNGSDGAGGSPGSWVPLLVRDIPTIILWLDTLHDRRKLLDHAQEQAEKVLVDTEQSISLGDTRDGVLAEVYRLAVRDGIPVTDFAFKRLRPLQTLVASAFDDPRRTPQLAEVNAVRVAGTTQLGGHLFALWMAERLGWKRQGDTFMDRQGRPVTVTISDETNECSMEVTVTMNSGESVRVATQTAGCADVDLPDGAQSHPVVTVPANGELLLEEVDSIGGDPLYRSALALLAP